MNSALVIGATGLLGSHLEKELQLKGFDVFSPMRSFSWLNTEALKVEFAGVIEAFKESVTAGEAWSIYWAAGIGSMHSTEQDLQCETLQLNECINLILNSGLDLARGTLMFSSSAGAIYAGSREFVVTESSTVAPINAYGLEKLKQEKMLESIFCKYPDFRVLIARISTLYGTRNKRSNRLGLLAQISRNVVLGQPVHVYVPLETMRDYIHVQDAAICIIKTMSILQNQSGGCFIKIIANEKSHSVAEIISIFKRISHKNIRSIHSRIPSSGFYKKIIQFQSIQFREASTIQKRNLMIGISQLLKTERAQLVAPTQADHLSY